MNAGSRSVVWLDPRGHAGNRALRYLTAAGIAGLVPGADIHNINLPEWGLVRADPIPVGRVVYSGEDRFWLDADGLADCLRRRVMDSLVVEGHPYHISHYPARAECRALLGPMRGGEEAEGFGPRDLVCSVRAAEILTGLHGNYLPLPPGYYAKLMEMTGLDLVFFGQLGEDPYTASLRASFPTARFIPGRNPGFDFETLRRSRNIALSISTFAWLAAWLSEADNIHMPVAGIYHPLQQGNQGFLPTEDPSYQFMLLPFGTAVNVITEPETFRAQQAFLGDNCVPIGVDEVRNIVMLGTQKRAFGPYVGGFDPEFYAAQLGQREIVNPLEHYLRTGCLQHRMQAPVDPQFYLHRYPEAALSIALGKYDSALHHYVAFGWKQGFLANRVAIHLQQ